MSHDNLKALNFRDPNAMLLQLRGRALHEVTHYGEPNNIANFKLSSGIYQAASSNRETLALYAKLNVVCPGLPVGVNEEDGTSNLFMTDGRQLRAVHDFGIENIEDSIRLNDSVQVQTNSVNFNVSTSGVPYEITQSDIQVVVALDKSVLTDEISGKAVALTVDRSGVKAFTLLEQGNAAIASIRVDDALRALYVHNPSEWGHTISEMTHVAVESIQFAGENLIMAGEVPLSINVNQLSSFLQSSMPMEWAQAGGTVVPKSIRSPCTISVRFEPEGMKPAVNAVVQFQTQQDMRVAYKMAMVDRRVTHLDINSDDREVNVEWKGSLSKSLFGDEPNASAVTAQTEKSVQENVEIQPQVQGWSLT